MRDGCVSSEGSEGLGRTLKTPLETNSFLKIKENISHSQEVDFCSTMALTIVQSFFINTWLPVKRSDNQIGLCNKCGR